MAAAKAVTMRNIKITSSQRLAKLKQIQVQNASKAKLNWAITAYSDWRNERLETMNYDYAVFSADLNDLPKLDKDCLSHALCLFIPEVMKRNGEMYPGKTLYQMIVAIQKHLNINRIPWQLISDYDFLDVRTVLDNVMQERTAMNLGVDQRQADLFTYEMEEELWRRGFLGEDTPDKLRFTVYVLIGLNLIFRSVQDHYLLRHWTPKKESQLTFHTIQGMRVIKYKEDSVTKTHNGGLKDMKHDRKQGTIWPNNVFDRDPVRLIDKYLGLCPPLYTKSNFYLQSLKKPTPSCWYSGQVVGEKSIGRMLADVMKEAGIAGYFTGHSLRRSGGSRLFQAGVQRKIVKECTGHRSDAVDKYQITSDDQKRKVSNIIAQKPSSTIVQSSMDPVGGTALDPKFASKPECASASTIVSPDSKQCTVNLSTPKCDCTSNNIGSLVENIVKKVDSEGKTTIKIQIEICKE